MTCLILDLAHDDTTMISCVILLHIALQYHWVQFSGYLALPQGQLIVRRAGGVVCGGSRSLVPRAPHAMSVSSAALRACALLLCLVAGTRQLSIKEFVVPTAIEVGKDVELRCQYELEGNETEEAIYVKWWWTPGAGNGDEPMQLYQRIGGHDAQAIHHYNTSQIEIKGNDSIVLLDVKPVDSGTYGCEVTDNDIELRKHEKLIVFSMGTGPAINYTLLNSEAEDEEDMLLIECAAEDVAPFPVMTISYKGETINTTSIVEDISENGLYKIFVNATVSLSDADEDEIRCELTYFSLEHPPYVDVKKYVPAGRDAPPSTEPPEDETEPDPTHDSLQNPSDDGIRLHCSWVLLTLAAVVTHLHAPL